MQPAPNIPQPAQWMLRAFALYCTRYLAKHFHAVRLLRPAPEVPPDKPLVVYLNHPSWWDPLICLEVARHYFPQRVNYAPIDAAMLQRYGFMKKLGFFGVEQGTRRGAAMFLRSSEAILARGNTSIWLTPQGHFADPRKRPIRFAAGLSHLARRMPDAVYLPMAVEYPFWTERTPEALVHFGAPAREANDLEDALGEAQDALAAAAMVRDPADFHTLLSGSAGEGGFYQSWRRLRARWRGEQYRREHGTGP